MSKLFGRAAQLLRLADEIGLEGEDFDTLIVPPVLRFTVDYDMSFSEQLAACGCDYNSPDIKEGNLVLSGEKRTGKRELIAKLVHLNYGTSSDPDRVGKAVLSRSEGSWLPNHAETLAFGAAFPYIQCKFPIISLGALVSDGNFQHVLMLTISRGGSDRHLFLHVRNLGFNKTCRFLVVHEASEP